MGETEQRTHSLLSPSSAHRWLNCPPSARMCEQFPSETSIYAEEGTTAHALGELKLLNHYGMIKNEEYQKRLEVVRQNSFYQQNPDEMEQCTDFYLTVVRSLQNDQNKNPLFLQVEEEVNFNEYVPDGHGTADCFFVEGTTLNIIDYKHGKGVLVEATYNPQLMLYALGIYLEYNWLFEFKNIKMTICQPRLDNVNSFQVTLNDLLKFGEEVKRVAPLAWEGKGNLSAGKWCKFCRAKAVCSAQAERVNLIKDKINNDPNCLSYAELTDILNDSESMIDYLNSVRAYALNQILEGVEINGYKCVEGRSRRIFRDEVQALKIASELIPENELYEKKPISLTSIEKKLGKKTFNEKFSNLVYSPKGSPTLAKEDDKRPSYIPNTPEDDFKNL